MFTAFTKGRTKPFTLSATAPAAPATARRIDSIDLLRGLVMIIMALDHVRDLTHKEAMIQDPLAFATTTPLLFFTRWITHFCAPVFVFLAGTSGYLQGLRKTKGELSAFLIKRGLWLVLLEVTLITFGITFDVHFGIFALQTIWAIGISMVFLGLAIWLPFKAILALGLLIVLGHNSLDFSEAVHKGAYDLPYLLLHRQGFFPLWDGHGLLVLYPFLSWTGLMLLGYCFGRLFTLYEGNKRRKVLTATGLGVVIFFIALRATNLYGDPSHWSVQKNGLFTLLSFLNTTKYPPSLLYMCMTIGPAVLFLAWADPVRNVLSNPVKAQNLPDQKTIQRVRNGFADIVTVYGRVPFFYYLLHFYLIHLLAVALSMARGHGFAQGAAGAPNIPFKFVFPGEGVSLGAAYLIWLGVVAALYPLCSWYSRYKQTHRQWWLSYL